ncbi:DinB family protein [Catalinimonas niigatensis]|uniref:DinB family protein n=1 Tax=Catalinimonas niigatensis TaxID=1397264 RepID=UPI002664E4AE|nr:DinB family protein [Catalinimonas niigatensis]WPP49243.1 DinB family protein [Catalinimonas niigatensis]
MKEIANIRKARENFVDLLDGMDETALNHIPQGFNNNIIWNFGHIISSQQILCYKLSGLPMHVSEEVVESFKKGTKPNGTVSSTEIAKLREQAMSTLNKLQEDVDKQRFQDYHAYTTSFGITLTNIEEAIRFDAMHESLHLGYAMALRRAVKKELELAS